MNNPINIFPEELFQMFINPYHQYYDNFHKNIRIYNNSFGFISTNAGFIGDVNIKLKNKGPQIIRIDGALYHLHSDSTFPNNE
jgi:hypothetical protein